MSTLTRTAITLDEATAFIWHEAHLLDRQDYKPWLALWTQQGHYIIPVDRDTTDHAQALNIAYDDQAMRAIRVKRLQSGFAMSSAPSARTVRTVSRFVPMEQNGDAITLHAAQIIVEYKYQRTRVMAADVDYRLIRDQGVLKLDRKVVTLINADDFQHGIGYLF